MDKRQFLFGLLFASLFGGIIALGGYKLMEPDTPSYPAAIENQNIRYSNFTMDTSEVVIPQGLNFVFASKVVTPAVVHIRTMYEAQSASRGGAQGPFDELLRDYFDGQSPQGRQSAGSGSGVIISEDGYIITNNHVVDKADEIEVVLNDNQSYKGKVIGTDSQTDIALVKIEANNLPTVKMGNSDKIQIGEWVLAVGSPFGDNFRSTVTAGIVSAKGRNINIIRDKNNLQIESFIQTDAVVNPGNSGGPLVNVRGELIGINTAIATPTGTYAGYSFAVPATLVKKVVADLKEFGVVQRALLGINIRDVDSKLNEEEDLGVLEGVYVIAVQEDRAADEAGIEKGDVIISVDDQKVTKTAELQEKVALHRPGDKIKVQLIRGGKEKTVYAVLKNTLGTTNTVASSNNFIISGATFEDVSKKDKENLDLEGGVKIAKLEKGKWKDAGLKEGFIITGIDKRKINNVEDLSSLLTRTAPGDGLLIEGIYPNGEKAYYGIGW
ncbi:Do family serine endopeptidase [Reichenbachiella sp. MALMAid0571]|uniref:Do family serine endopeptidase n=1 Tax=Reichenbachiella sp. MALMAid0571 TaxID=3143939 RepID=UPI0032DE7558